MDVYTAGKKIEALEARVEELEASHKKLSNALDDVVNQANRAISNLKAQIQEIAKSAPVA